jgi:hypothetical protein
MAWMIAAVLVLFYLVGVYAFHQTSLIGLLPYIALLVVILDFLAARLFRKISANKST